MSRFPGEAVLVLFAAASLVLTSPAGAEDETNPARECRKLLKQAIEKVEGKGYSSALELLDRVFECDPENPDAFFYRGTTLLNTGDSTGAVSALESGVERAPRSWRLNLLLARLRLAMGETEAASGILDRLLQVKPDHGEALYLQGLMRLAEGDSTEAIRVWRIVLENELLEYPE